MSNCIQPQSVLFACDHNSIRSPMAEGLLKQHIGTSIFVQSAGVKGDMEIDGLRSQFVVKLGWNCHGTGHGLLMI